MRVLFATSEVATLYKLGGLGDVSYALPIALGRIGVTVTVAMPYYRAVIVKPVACVGIVAVSYAGVRELVFVFRGKLPHSTVEILLFRHPRLDDYMKQPMGETFAFFSQCVATLVTVGSHITGKPYDVVHCHDWHTALVPVLLGETRKGGKKKQQETVQSQSTKTVLTIHNLLYQGTSKENIVDHLGLPKGVVRDIHGPFGETINMLREGIEHADIVTTVSPTYAKEILTHTYGEHVDEVLRRRQDHLVGILNGISMDQWDPRQDMALYHQYDARSVVSGKQVNKDHLQKSFQLPIQLQMPLVGFVGRLEPLQKGIDILLPALEVAWQTHEFQCVIMGTGSPRTVAAVEAVAKRYPTQMRFVNTFDEKLARRIYAASDVLAIPSKFEPCGLTQMIAMRYGTIPLVRHTGGLADTVTEGVTGFVFDAYTASALTKKLIQTLDCYGADAKQWKHMQQAGMREDVSWTSRAKQYRALYEHLIKA